MIVKSCVIFERSLLSRKKSHNLAWSCAISSLFYCGIFNVKSSPKTASCPISSTIHARCQKSKQSFKTNKTKIMKSRIHWHIDIKEIDLKWKLRSSSPFNQYTFCYIGTYTSCWISISKDDGNLKGRVSFLWFKLE